jgi:hypothetical protein
MPGFLCKPLQKPCDAYRSDIACIMCLAEYFVKENQKIKDELKLIRAIVEQNRCLSH